ncbi:MAG TPA: DUF2793 domain-containing protein [Arenicellales bacterium]|nr:DUF2793 domain-containing protein [Arenicellales bacterium]
MNTTPDIGIPYIAGQQARPEITHNEALALLQAMANGVISRGVNTPPAGSPGPQEGDAYIVGNAPTGDWAGRADRIAVYYGGEWRFVPGDADDGQPLPMDERVAGLRVWVRDENALRVWRPAGSPPAYDWRLFEPTVEAEHVSYDGSNAQAALDDLAAVRTGQPAIIEPGTSLTLTAAHNGRLIGFTAAGDITVTLPEAATETLDPGFLASLVKLGDGDVTLATEGVDEYEAVEVDSALGKADTIEQAGGTAVVTLLRGPTGSPPAQLWYATGRIV